MLGQRGRGELLRVAQLECIYRQAVPTRAQARRAEFDYIEVFFNRRRLHSALGYCTPAAYGNKIRNTNAAHAA
jgi:transposase InsO family protein